MGMALAFVSCIVTLLAVWSRPDSSDELYADHFFAAFVVAPLWAANVYWYTRRKESLVSVILITLLTYAVATYCLITFNIAKAEARASAIRDG